MRFALISAFLLYSLAATAQTSVDELARMQQQLRFQQMNQQLEMQRLQIEADRLRAETWRLDEENRAREQVDNAASLLAERQRKQEEATKIATEEAEELRSQIHMAGVRNADNFYMLAAASLLTGFFVLAVRRRNKEGEMKYEQKFGVVLVVVAALGSILALVISRDWAPQLDVLQNVMLTLRIAFIEDDGSSSFSKNYLLDIPTKFVLLAFFFVAAYGLLAYLGITPAFGGKKEHAPSTEVVS